MVGHQHDRSDPDRRFKYLMLLALLAVLVYTLNRWLIIPQTHSPAFFRDYLGDVLALPVYIPASLYLARKLELVGHEFHLTVVHVLGAVALFALFFEGLVPLLHTGATADPIDVLAYLAGGLLVLGVSRSADK